MVILPNDHHLAALRAISEGSCGRDIRDRVGYGSCIAQGSSTIT
jgi:hypothetical protein